MGLRNFVKEVLPEINSGIIHIGSPEVPAGDWIDPNLDQEDYRNFLKAASRRARGLSVDIEPLPFEGEVVDDKEEK